MSAALNQPEGFMETIERRTETEVRVEDKLYAFGSSDEADRFERCAREERPSECVAQYPPRSVTTVDAPGERHGSGAGITIEPPPGIGDDE
jgi:hypothetical protein